MPPAVCITQISGNNRKMMKKALVLFALVAFVSSAPQPRKLFHEHVEDFVDIIMQESSEEVSRLMEVYSEFDEFWKAIDYMKTNNFKEIIYEMESLPEFVAVIDFLENDNIDVHYFIDMLNDIIENVERNALARQSVSGRDLTSFTKDCIAVFPKDKLAALFDQKMAEDEEFKTAIENLESEEWSAVFSALWESEVFKAEVATLSENGIEISVLFEQLLAIFGQN
ncbi:unnamed protein product [Spodoptera exigua]|nr:unnamed protein product [Spodoptera exigua]